MPGAPNSVGCRTGRSISGMNGVHVSSRRSSAANVVVGTELTFVICISSPLPTGARGMGGLLYTKTVYIPAAAPLTCGVRNAEDPHYAPAGPQRFDGIDQRRYDRRI